MVYPSSSFAAGGFELYTPYTGISATPGETITYSVDVINNSSSIQDVSFSVSDLPKDWTYTITSDGHEIHNISTKPDGNQTVSLELQVPLKIEKGNYTFKLIGKGNGGRTDILPISVDITEKGTFKTELTSEQPNMEGHSTSDFSYTVTLKNRTAEEQHYALTTKAPRGWNVQFKVDGKNVTSVTLEANGSKDIDVSVTPAENVKAGKYKIPVKAATSSTSAKTELEAVITGTYDIEISTPSGRLSTDINAGSDKTIELIVKNTGSSTLTDIKLDSSLPPDWEVEFEPANLDKLEAGKSVKVKAKLKASKDAIAGDYVAEFTAETPEASSKAQFRVSVKTSMAWGLVGIVIIIGVVGSLYYIVRKYGRR